MSGGSRRPQAAAFVSLGVAHIIGSAIFAFTSLYLARSLIPHEYGRFAFGLSVQTLLVIGVGLGLTTAVTAAVARARVEDTETWPVVTALLAIRVASVVTAGIGAALWAGLTSEVIPFLAGLAAGTFLLLDFLVGIMKGQLKARSVAFVAIAQPVCFLTIVVLAQPDDAVAALGAFLGGSAVALLSATALTSGTMHRWARVGVRVRPELRQVGSLAGYAYVLTFLQLGYSILPIVLLGLNGRYEEAASLSVLMALVRFLPDGIAAALSADYFPRLHANRDRRVRNRLFRRYLLVILACTLTAGGVLAVFGQPLLSVLFSGRYDHLGEYLPMAALLIIGLPIEAQLVWTLLSDGLGRIAVAALTTRLLLVLAGATIFVWSAPDASFLLLILAPVAATGVSLVMQGGALAMFEMAEQRAARRLAASGAK